MTEAENKVKGSRTNDIITTWIPHVDLISYI